MAAVLYQALDAEFVYARGRRLSLTERYPALFTAMARMHVFVAQAATRPRACAIVRPFSWCADGSAWRGAMIGMVWTHSDARGRGLATRLLEEILADQRAAGADFAVLWSALDAFYTARGWRAADCGMLGVAATPRPPVAAARSTDVQSIPLATPNATRAIAAVEALRRHCPEATVPRAALDWRTVPLPATRCTLHVAEAAWALSGHADDGRTWLYEMAGTPAAYAALWRAVARDAASITVNVADGSPAYDWLRRHEELHWQRQRLAYWQALGPRAANLNFARSYVPWFDRI